MARWQACFDRYKSVADLVTIYMKEAHPTDRWYLTAAQPLVTPATASQRSETALAFQKSFTLTVPLYIDDITDETDKQFNAWPEKVVVIEDEKIEFISGEAPFHFDISLAEVWLKRRFPSL